MESTKLLLLDQLGKKRSIRGIETFLKSQGFTIVQQSGEDYKVWYNRRDLITVKVVEPRPEESLELYMEDEYDLLVGRYSWGDKITYEVLPNL
ncbi:hypothetical protein [Enterococcus hulanensis]|uniref:hypothetical protein n=1 Tax=Enterococcus hulanensis TaxID=2559929 RepID=UPI0010F6DD74|nr:hypothetical protein [Enterococcus hulanensis]